MSTTGPTAIYHELKKLFKSEQYDFVWLDVPDPNRILRFIPISWAKAIGKWESHIEPPVFIALNIVEAPPKFRFVASKFASTNLKNSLERLAERLKPRLDSTERTGRNGPGRFGFYIKDLPSVDLTDSAEKAAKKLWSAFHQHYASRSIQNLMDDVEALLEDAST